MAGTLTALLHAAADRDPTRDAVRERGRVISYGDLVAMTDAISAALSARGAVRGQRIGIWLNKSVEAVVAIHAVLRCGGVYVPIDPTAPPLRAAAQIADCGVSWLFTTPDRFESLQQRAPDVLEPIELITVGTSAWTDALATAAPATVATVDADDPAYILYTSGSTGAAKGVTLTHRNARAFVDWAAAELRLSDTDVLASHAPLHFDLSILDIFGAAAAGACVCLVPESWHGNGATLVRFILAERVSVWYSVPTALRRIADAATSGPLTRSRLRVVAFAGEVYPTHHIRRLRRALPADAVLYNLYGPTETNVCTYHRIDDDDLAETAELTPPIGRVCPYATAVLTDERGVVLPEHGERTGELCVGGASVMVGYWNDPAKSAERFLTHAGRSFYRTGDIVRRDDDGRLRFVGRRDSQVKIKGYRVELTEIEAVLGGRPEVDECACVLTRDASGSAHIVAYATLRAGATADERVLRRHCGDFLPGYMVPERIEITATLGHTSTGKLDRTELARRAAEDQSCTPA